jgi:wyosine [tRNA(Phe)-imidazoG37] synthetase (radical SAM superfamily)
VIPRHRSFGQNGNGHDSGRSTHADAEAFGYPRDFLNNKFVYLVLSQRAGGLSIGIDLNPSVRCDFNCVYCEVDRGRPSRFTTFDAHQLAEELHQMVELVQGNRLAEWPHYDKLSAELRRLRMVALSGDGEPTMSPDFLEAVHTIVQVRATRQHEYFKIAVLTNSTRLDRPQVQEGIGLLTREDEVWAKLDGGTQEHINRVNGSGFRIGNILSNILMVGRRRPIVIQSLFPEVEGAGPSEAEIQEYAVRLKQLKEDGAEISLVQIYSAVRPMARPGCRHLPLKVLSGIARTVRQTAGLRAEVF